MQFLIHAFDYSDPEALQRRLNCREEHLVCAKTLKENGKLIIGGAMLDADNKMIGSVVVMEYDDREDLDEWLKNEVYVTGKVWDRIDIYPVRLAIR